MLVRAKSLRRNRSETDLCFLHVEEGPWQESVAAQSQQDPLKRVEFERAQYIQIQRPAETRQQDEKQKNQFLKRYEERENLESKYQIELREFFEQRAERRRLYQFNKYEAQLAEFREQRAQARREYRASKVRVEKLGDKVSGAASASSRVSQAGAETTFI